MPQFDAMTTWLMAGSFGGAVASAVLPWINAELLMLSAMPLAAAHGALLPLVVVFTLGQMTGKSIMFWLSSRSTLTPPRMRDAVEKWRGRFERHPRWALACVFVSAALGFPPFFAVSIAAGTFGMAFGAFLAAGGAGRFVHFAAFALLINSQLPNAYAELPGAVGSGQLAVGCSQLAVGNAPGFFRTADCERADPSNKARPKLLWTQSVGHQTVHVAHEALEHRAEASAFPGREPELAREDPAGCLPPTVVWRLTSAS